MFRKPEATMSTISLEGVPLITSYTRSSLTGWTVAAGISESSLVAPLWRSLAIASTIGGLLLLVGLAFAVRMATTIARGEMLHDLLVEELNHRVKNTLAILQSIAAQTFRSASRPEREKFEGRLRALAEAHNLLSTEKWQGSELQDVIDRVLQPYLLNNPERVRMFGPKVPLSPRLLSELRGYWLKYRPRPWLFPGAKQNSLCDSAVQRRLHRVVINDNGQISQAPAPPEDGDKNLVSPDPNKDRREVMNPKPPQNNPWAAARPATHCGYRSSARSSQPVHEHMAGAGGRSQAYPLAFGGIPQLDAVPFGIDAKVVRRDGLPSHLDLLLVERLHGDWRPGAGLKVHQMVLFQDAWVPIGESHHAWRKLLVSARPVDRECISVQAARDDRHVAFFLGLGVEPRQAIRPPGFLGVLLV
jgi:hypothetical protein